MFIVHLFALFRRRLRDVASKRFFAEVACRVTAFFPKQ